MGVGWMLEYLEALGLPFDHRGARADEMIEIFNKLFTEATPSHDGRFYEFKPLGFEPKPTRGRIPIWVGGHSPVAYRRTARYGDVFHAVFASPSTIAEQWSAVQAACADAGRDPATVELSFRGALHYGADIDDDTAFHGAPDQIVEQFGRLAEIGVSHITMDIAARGGVDVQIEVMRRFVSDVRPHVG